MLPVGKVRFHRWRGRAGLAGIDARPDATRTWVSGRWVRVQPGYRYRQPQWVSHHGRWILVKGHWASDRDGVPNRPDRDRDGDGVPNRRDSRPDNPHRR